MISLRRRRRLQLTLPAMLTFGLGIAWTIWREPGGENPFVTLNDHHGPIYAIAASPVAPLVVTGGFDGKVHLWDIGETPHFIEISTDDPVNACAISCDGTLLATGGFTDEVKLWSLPSGESQGVLKGHGRGVRCLAFSPVRPVLAAGSMDGSIHVWHSERRERIGTLALGNECGGVAYSWDGTMLAGVDWAGRMRIWDVGTWNVTHSADVGSGYPGCIGWTTNNTAVLIAGSGSSLYEYTLPSKTVKVTRRIFTMDPINSFSFSPNREFIAVSGGSTSDPWPIARAGDVRIVRKHDFSQAAMLRGHFGAVAGAVYTHDGNTIASICYDGCLRLWHVPP